VLSYLELEMPESIRVAADVGSRLHAVAIGDPASRLLDEVTVDHRSQGSDAFFDSIARQ